MFLEGGYCLPSLANSAAITLKCLLGDICPIVSPGQVSKSVWDTIRKEYINGVWHNTNILFQTSERDILDSLTIISMIFL